MIEKIKIKETSIMMHPNIKAITLTESFFNTE